MMLENFSLENGSLSPRSQEPTFYSTFRQHLQNRVELRGAQISWLIEKIKPIPSKASLILIEKERFKKEHERALTTNALFSTALPEQAYIANPQNQNLLNWLKEKGYTHLSNKLAEKKGAPWDDFLTLRSPILIQQLFDIYTLCTEKLRENQEAQNKILHFSLEISSSVNRLILSGEEDRAFQAIDVTKNLLGELQFLINKDPMEVLKILASSSNIENIANLEKAFTQEINQIYKELQNYYLLEEKTGLESPEIALNNRIPYKIATSLLNENGTINFGLISFLSDIFLTNKQLQINHEVNLFHALKLLDYSPQLRAEFEEIKKPPHLTRSAEQVIRASIGLNADIPITDYHVRLTILMALLSHLRQGGERSCFAVSVAIEVLASHLNFCLRDLKQLLLEGKLTRKSGFSTVEMPFITRIQDDNLFKTLSFDREGTLVKNGRRGLKLHAIPALQGACQAIGCPNYEKTIQILLDSLPPPINGELYKLSINDLLEKLAKVTQDQAISLRNDGEISLKKRSSRARFAFTSHLTNPLLKIWENAIAGMAEAEEGSLIKTNNIIAALDALSFLFGDLKIPKTELAQNFLLHIEKTLYSKMRFLYDPTVEGPNKKERKSKKGAFILYGYHQRINDVGHYVEFLKKVVQESCEEISSKIGESEKRMIFTLKELILPDIPKVRFIGYLLARYHPDNREIISKLPKKSTLPIETLSYTPWLNPSGNNSQAVLKVYFECDEPIKKEEFIQNNAQEALKNVINICKKMSKREKQLYLNNPYKLKPLSILGKHRLPFMAGTPLLVEAWNSPLPTEEWINLTILKPGKKISNTQIEKNTRRRLIEGLKEELLPLHFKGEPLDLAIKAIDKLPKKCSITFFRQTIVQTLKGFSLHQAKREKLIRNLDTLLYLSLPETMKKELEKSAIHFADTNTFKGGQDIHFVFLVNPGTGELEIWKAHADGSHLKAIDQNYWLKNQKWEFLLIPDEVATDDMVAFSPIDSDLIFR